MAQRTLFESSFVKGFDDTCLLFVPRELSNDSLITRGKNAIINTLNTIDEKMPYFLYTTCWAIGTGICWWYLPPLAFWIGYKGSLTFSLCCQPNPSTFAYYAYIYPQAVHCGQWFYSSTLVKSIMTTCVMTSCSTLAWMGCASYNLGKKAVKCTANLAKSVLTTTVQAIKKVCKSLASTWFHW
jgi:hypothetical protein